VYPVGGKRQGHIHPVIDQEGRTRRPGLRQEFLGQIVQVSGGQVLLPELDRPNTGRQGLTNRI
jgi:hypothetical protein